MERINGSITSSVKSRQKPDENISTILELDIHSSLLPFVIPGMQTVVAKDMFSDPDGRLLLHKVFRYYTRKGGLGNDESDDGSDDSEEGGRYADNRRRKDGMGENRMPPKVLESFLTSEDPNFAMDREQLEAEFGITLSESDVRRALYRIGDVTLVDKVKLPKKNRRLLDWNQYDELMKYIREYLQDMVGDADLSFLFQWEAPPDTDDEEGYGFEELHNITHSPDGKPLLSGNHHAGIKFTKWKNVRFENETKLADFRIDTRVVRIAGADYDKKRVRSASFFEFSTDTDLKSGSHTVGNATERASSSRISSCPREFAEASFFLTVDFDWLEILWSPEAVIAIDEDKLRVLREEWESFPKSFFLCYCKPMAVRFEDALTIIKKNPRSAPPSPKTRNRLYKPSRWLDVDDFVDIIGLIYCRGEEYVCWRDACWDPVARKRLVPIEWRFQDFLDGKFDPHVLYEEDSNYGLDDDEVVDREGTEGLGQEADMEDTYADNLMKDWTPDSEAAIKTTRSQKGRGHREESEYEFEPNDDTSAIDIDQVLEEVLQRHNAELTGHQNIQSSPPPWITLPPRPDPRAPSESLFD